MKVLEILRFINFQRTGVMKQSRIKSQQTVISKTYTILRVRFQAMVDTQGSDGRRCSDIIHRVIQEQEEVSN